MDNEYEKQAEDFLKTTKTTMTINFKCHGKHFVDDDKERDIYTITLSRGTRTYTFDFGNSISSSGFKLYNILVSGKKERFKPLWLDKTTYNHDRDLKKLKADVEFLNSGLKLEIIYPKEPTHYDILSCLDGNMCDNDFKSFCSSFGYDEDSRKAHKIFKDVQEEYKQLQILFNDFELEKLQEIN